MSELFVDVCIPPLAERYTYLVPAGLEGVIDFGHRVRVPLGRRTAEGFVVRKGTEGPSNRAITVKPLSASVDGAPVFTLEQFTFFDWIARYYGVPLSHVIETAIPNLVAPKSTTEIRLIDGDAKLKGTTQRRIVELLVAAGGALPLEQLNREIPSAAAALRRLKELNVVAADVTTVDSRERFSGNEPRVFPPLSETQEFSARHLRGCLDERRFSVSLLHGVTGSGKTEVYIEAIRHCLEAGGGALVLVPEIALTPQLIERFERRLGAEIAVLHSGLAPRARADAWRALVEGRCRVALGARSAVFAPIHDLRMIVIDEEHDGSYKQGESLRYNARDLAIVRARQNEATVVLGSATPSLESYHHAKTKKYAYLTLPQRARATAPLDIELVDMNTLKPWDMPAPHVSPRLRDALADALSRGEQAFVLFNRRGFASYLQCERCEKVVECPNCSVTLTFHRGAHQLLCHYCGLTSIPPAHCDHCREPEKEAAALVQRGAGTERIFEELGQVFPEARIDRLDRDSTTSFDEYRKVLQRLKQGETQILVGTQMIAKGHDLPNVTVSAVADCDIGLQMPDFRAAERAFQLLLQAAGRAGRADLPGRVILQTRLPKHPALLAVKAQNYLEFAERELHQREQLGYPPYTRLARIIAQSDDKNAAAQTLVVVRKALELALDGRNLSVRVLGPAPAPLEKLRTRWRVHLLLKSKSVQELHFALGVVRACKIPQRVHLAIDIDPQDML